jgi:hypothetical protein
MDTTGSSPEQGSQQTTAPDDWVENPYVQIEGGFLAGLAEGFVPFGGLGHQLLDAGEVIPHGSPQARFGLAFGQVLGGIVTLLGGVTGEVLGGIATTSGIGAAIGVPTIAVSTTFVIGGFANIAAGLSALPQAAMSQGSGSGGTRPPDAAAQGAAGGPRAGKPFTPKMKGEAWKANEAKHGGQATCDSCKQPIVPSERSARGIKPPPNEGQLDHVVPRVQNGNGSLDNAQYLCRTCNRAKSDK